MHWALAMVWVSAPASFATGSRQDRPTVVESLATEYRIHEDPLHGPIRGPAKDLADVDGDGEPEFVLGMPDVEYGEIQFSRVVCISGSSGRVLWSSEGKIAGDRFGLSLDTGADLDGDGIEDAVAGAPSSSLAGFEGVGSVRALSGRNGRVLWERFGPSPSSNFGAAVAFCGDLDGDGLVDVVGGAPGSGSGAPSGGEVVALSGRTGEVLWRATLPLASGALGWSLASHPDVQGDGVPDIAAGLPSLGIDGRGGVAFLSGASGRPLRVVEGPLPFGAFGRSLATWQSPAGPLLLAGAPFARNAAQESVGAVLAVPFQGSAHVLHWGMDDGAEFGCSLATGDVDRDGVEDFSVGAQFERDAKGIPSGCVRIYRSGLGFAEIAVAAPSEGSKFGAHLSITRSGTLAVSAPSSSAPGAFVAGAVQVLTGGGELVKELHGVNAASEFGRSVASIGDIDADGFDDFVAGVPFASDPDLFRRGEVRLYSGRNGEHRWTVKGTYDLELLGEVVASAGDVDLDGIPDFAIGIPRGLDDHGFEAGAVEIHSGRGGRLQRLVGMELGEQFGSAMTIAGDVDGDGICDLAIGAPGAYGSIGRATGAVRILLLGTGRVWKECVGGIEGGRFGHALTSEPRAADVGPRRIFIGAPLGTRGSTLSPGSVFSWEPQKGHAEVFAIGTSPGDEFGSELDGGVDLDGDLQFDVVVGAPNAGEGRGAFVLLSGDGTPICSGLGQTMSAHLGAAVLLVPGGADGSAGWIVTGSPGAVGNYQGPTAPAPSIQFGAGRIDVWNGSGQRVASSALAVGFSAFGASLACLRGRALEGERRGGSAPWIVVGAPIEAADGRVHVLRIP